MTDSERPLISPEDTAFLTAIVGRAVEELMGAGLSELQAMQLLDAVMMPSRLYRRYQTWSRERREDMARSIEGKHPPDGLLNIMERVYRTAEERASRVTVPPIVVQPTPPVPPEPRGDRLWVGILIGLLIAGVTCVAYLYLAAKG